MTKPQLKVYDELFEKIRQKIGGLTDGDVNGKSVTYEYEKGTFYVQGHGYLDDLVIYDEVPVALANLT